MRYEIIKLREKMKEKKIDFYLVPTTDYHGSEYVHEYFQCRSFLSGFTGSAGTLLVGLDEAWLWTDGRYFIQAEMQLKESGIKLMKMNEPGVPTLEEHLDQVMNEDSVLGFDGKVIDCSTGFDFEKKHNIVWNIDLVDEIWNNRPKIIPSEIYKLPQSVTGESSFEKLKRIRNYMNDKSVDYHLITCLEDIAWLFNMRGSDVKYTPVFYAYALIGKKFAFLYLMNEECNDIDLNDVQVRPYNQIFNDLKELDAGSLLLDQSLASYALAKTIPSDIKIIDGINPCEIMKSQKNDKEVSSTRNAHIKDGVAMVKFIYWLKNVLHSPFRQEISEISASDYLEVCRREQAGFMDLSFETISGYGPNGAIVHYSATPETNKLLKPEGFLLVDSGAHYSDGSTDITRTISLGNLTQKMKEDYTTVLRGHIALAKAEFEEGTLGVELDKLARKPLQERGLDYNHGTGHGVGHLLSIHEGPQYISPRGDKYGFYEGMITSNEPGYYLEGEYGIRLENETICVKKDNKLLGFETITFCPFDRESINREMLTEDEIEWLNIYHSQVYKKLSPYLDDDIKIWLKQSCEPI